MTEIQSVHMWGFFDEDGKARPSSDCAVSTKTPWEMWEQVLSNLAHFGRDNDDGIRSTTVTRDLDGFFRGISFETSAGPIGMPARMWHIINSPKDEWPAKDQDAAEMTVRASLIIEHHRVESLWLPEGAHMDVAVYSGDLSDETLAADDHSDGWLRLHRVNGQIKAYWQPRVFELPSSWEVWAAGLDLTVRKMWQEEMKKEDDD